MLQGKTDHGCYNKNRNKKWQLRDYTFMMQKGVMGHVFVDSIVSKQ